MADTHHGTRRFVMVMYALHCEQGFSSVLTGRRRGAIDQMKVERSIAFAHPQSMRGVLILTMFDRQ
jgi:hypothetical protein